MKRTSVILLGIIVGLTVAAVPLRATLVQLELYNTYGLVDFDNATLLAQGDYVQVIQGSIAVPNADGSAFGTVLALTTVGYNTASAGFLDYWPVEYDSSQAGLPFYVRFWNASTPAAATYYGDSAALTLPVGDQGGQALLDFTQLGSGSPHRTNQPFTAVVIPEPSNLLLFGLGVLALCWLKKRIQVAAT
jgi:hypothetical protein